MVCCQAAPQAGARQTCRLLRFIEAAWCKAIVQDSLSAFHPVLQLPMHVSRQPAIYLHTRGHAMAAALRPPACAHLRKCVFKYTAACSCLASQVKQQCYWASRVHLPEHAMLQVPDACSW